jgi:hypothetical protein
MRKKCTLRIAVLFLFLALFVMQGSSDNGFYYEYHAVYMDRATLEASVFYLNTGKDIQNPGKIYYKHPYLFINERYKGVHIINNSDPSKPKKEGFIVAPGCLDMAVKGDAMYLDNSVDLVCIDLNGMNLSGMKVTKRITKVFPEPVPPAGYVKYDYDRPEGLIIVGWIKEKIFE